jgi:inositol-pentakisphosphate 2-kinase
LADLHILLLPMETYKLSTDIALTYLAEGAANIVYRVSHLRPGSRTQPPTEISRPRSDSLIEGKLLRLRKDVPTATSVSSAQLSFEKLIKPLFEDDDLVEQVLVELPEGLVEKCNQELAAMHDESRSASNRPGTRLNERERYGLLVTDMTADPARHLASLELKPKWLVQSPTAPQGAVRCRTCALRRMRASGRREAPDFCPLVLVSGDEQAVESTIQAILRRQVPDPGTAAAANARLARWFLAGPLLHKLKALQMRFGKVGFVEECEVDEQAAIGMTLRDCSLYLQVREG